MRQNLTVCPPLADDQNGKSHYTSGAADRIRSTTEEQSGAADRIRSTTEEGHWLYASAQVVLSPFSAGAGGHLQHW